MNPSSEFAERLFNTFNGRFRLRWSDKRHEFHLEQRVHTGQIIPPPTDESGAWDTFDDDYQRARDGYVYVMSLRNGDRMPCPICGFTVAVPIMETRESVCDYCRAQGRDGRYVAAFYPLNHVLIEHLQDIDPFNGGPERVRKRIRARQIERNARELRAQLDEADMMVIDDKYQIEQRPMVGYGPKTAQRGDETRFL